LVPTLVKQPRRAKRHDDAPAGVGLEMGDCRAAEQTTAVRFTAMVRSQSASQSAVGACSGDSMAMPALLSSASVRPKRVSTFAQSEAQ
jgi:hypothetical protein